MIRRVALKGCEAASTAEIVLLAMVNVGEAGSRLNRVLQHADPAAISYPTLAGLGIAGVMYKRGHRETAHNEHHHQHEYIKIHWLILLSRQFAFLPVRPS